MAKHVPLRRCVVCRSSRPQAELLRFYKLDDAWQLDPNRKGGGRGAWLCRDKETCQRPKALKRFFRSEAEHVAAQVSDFLTTHAVTQTGAPPEPQPKSQTPAQTTAQNTTQNPVPTPNRGGMNVR